MKLWSYEHYRNGVAREASWNLSTEVYRKSEGRACGFCVRTDGPRAGNFVLTCSTSTFVIHVPLGFYCFSSRLNGTIYGSSLGSHAHDFSGLRHEQAFQDLFDRHIGDSVRTASTSPFAQGLVVSDLEIPLRCPCAVLRVVGNNQTYLIEISLLITSASEVGGRSFTKSTSGRPWSRVRGKQA